MTKDLLLTLPIVAAAVLPVESATMISTKKIKNKTSREGHSPFPNVRTRANVESFTTASFPVFWRKVGD